jgi:hypothetical protein
MGLEKFEGYWQPGTLQEYEEQQAETAKRTPLGSVTLQCSSRS